MVQWSQYQYPLPVHHPVPITRVPTPITPGTTTHYPYMLQMLYIATPPLPVPCSGSPGFFWIQPLGRFATVKTRVLWVLLTFLKVLTKPVSDMPGFAYTVSPFFYVFDISDVFRCFRVISVFSCIIRCFLCGLCNMAEYSMFYVFSVCLKLSETRVLLSKRVRQEPCQRRGFLQN